MPRVLGIDPGTVSIDVCGLADGQLYLDTAWPTGEALADPDRCVAELSRPGLPDLVVGPSGYGLPLCRAAAVTEAELRLAFLAAPEETGGIGGLRGFARRLARSGLPVMYTPGVIHLDTVPEHRKLNRVDLGTADKLCSAALAIADQQGRTGRSPAEVSLILLELGGAFSAALAVHRGQVVDGLGGSSGPIGWQSAGALDGEVAFLAGRVTKEMLFHGGVQSVSQGAPARRATALDAYVEGAVKAVRQLRLAAPEADEVLLSGRVGADAAMLQRLTPALSDIGAVRLLTGFAARAKQGAQGAALIADGLAGGAHRALVERLRVKEAKGTVLDHLYIISPDAARRRLGLVSDA
ncbi:MAG: DUF1464 family protein [Gemmatimonadales bacterium]